MIRAVIEPITTSTIQATTKTSVVSPHLTTEVETLETEATTEATPYRSLTTVFTDPQFLQVILAATALIGGGTAYMMKIRKDRLVKNIFREIDEIYSRYKMNTRRCETELLRLKNKVTEEMKLGRIREESFAILKDRIDEYLHEIRREIKKG